MFAIKGGSGKSTTALTLGADLALRGKSVLVVDMDPQGHLAEGLGISADTLEKDMSAVLDKRVDLPIQEIIVRVRDNIDLAPSNLRLARVTRQLNNQYRREDRLLHVLGDLTSRYDFVIIDCPPTSGVLSDMSLTASDRVIIPMNCDYYGMLGVSLALEDIEEIQREVNPNLVVEGVLPTRFTRTVNAREILDQVKRDLGKDMRIFAEIPETVKVREAVGLGKTLFEHAPESSAAIAYQKLTKEVLRNV